MTKPTRRRRKESTNVPSPNQLTSLAQNRREAPKNGLTKTSTKAKKLTNFSSIFENDPSSEEESPSEEPRVRASSRKRKKKFPMSDDSDDEFQESSHKRKKKHVTQTQSDAEDEQLLQEEERRKLQRNRSDASGSRAIAPTRSSPRTTKHSKTRIKRKDKPEVLPSRSSKRIQSRREKNLVVSYAQLAKKPEKNDDSADDFDIPIAAQKQNSKTKGVSRRAQRIQKPIKSSKRGRKSKTARNSDSDSTNDAGDDLICTQESNVSEPLSISIKPIKVRKKRRSPTEEKLIEYEMSRKRLSEEELSMLRMAFVKHYPPPPSNLQAQSRYEQQYGREMPQKMVNGLWKCELQPWSDRWWSFYQKFNDAVREKKFGKPPDKDPTITKKEAAAWAKEFYREHGDAKIPFAPPADDKSTDPEPPTGNKEEAAESPEKNMAAPDAGSSKSLGNDPPSPGKPPECPKDRKDVSASTANQELQPEKKSSVAEKELARGKKTRLVAVPSSELRSNVPPPSRVVNDTELHPASPQVPVKNDTQSHPETVPATPDQSIQSQPNTASQGPVKESAPTSTVLEVKVALTSQSAEGAPVVQGKSPSVVNASSIGSSSPPMQCVAPVATKDQSIINAPGTTQGSIDESAPTATVVEAKGSSTIRNAQGAPVVRENPPSVINDSSTGAGSLLQSVAQVTTKKSSVVNPPLLRSLPLSKIQALVARQPSGTQGKNVSASNPVELVTSAVCDTVTKNGTA